MYFPAPDESLWIGVVRVLLHVPGSLSLKDRRRVVQSVLSRVQTRQHCAGAEVGYLENPSMAAIAFTVVGNDPKHVRSRLDAIRNEADKPGDGYVGDSSLWVQRMTEVGSS